jgi:thiaminase/transcriptional activator TenA
MSFMQETINRSLPIWNACVDTPFVQELKKGTLPVEKFKQYMIQDSIYLKHYARIYGKAMYHSTVLKDIQLYYSVLRFVTDKESAVRLSYLKQFGMTDDDIEGLAPLPENQDYIDFMLEIAETGSVSEMLMAVLPCMLSYSYMFRKIASEPDTEKSRYWDFIEDYAAEGYAGECNRWCTFADEKCNRSSASEKEKLTAIFEKASLLELDFWTMAYRE